jgi:hypothetical protein
MILKGDNREFYRNDLGSVAVFTCKNWEDLCMIPGCEPGLYQTQGTSELDRLISMSHATL